MLKVSSGNFVTQLQPDAISLARAIRQAHKIPITTGLPLKLPLHGCRLLQMKIPSVAADDDPYGLGKANAAAVLIE